MKYTNLRWWLPKFLCLMAAFAFWVYVMNEQNPLVENSYTVPVEVRNLDRSLVALNVPQRVKVKIRMNRSDLVSMRSDNIKAYVDLDGFTDGDYPNTPIHISVPGNETVISQDQTYFDLFIDTYAVKSLPAQVEFIGALPAGFRAEIHDAGIYYCRGSQQPHGSCRPRHHLCQRGGEIKRFRRI